MGRNILLVLFACYSSVSVAQSILKGSVIDLKTQEPIPGSVIQVKNSQEGTVTDYDGQFELRSNQNYPVTILISSIGYANQEIVISSAKDRLKIKMVEEVVNLETVQITGSRISDKIKESPLTVESLDPIGIKQTPASNFYDGLGSLKDVDLTAASLGFKVINTRGFNSTSPVRSLQIIDGVDNQAPGLNFSLGNFLGCSELDVQKVDLVIGASSAYYGPNAFNGVISMNTKNPFLHQGLSALIRAGERNMYDLSMRYANAIKRKDGLPFLAYKLNIAYLRADDWQATNYTPVYEEKPRATISGGSVADNPGGFDAVNVYGDEYFSPNNHAGPSSYFQEPGLGIFYRTGYQEKDLVDYNTRNLKLAGHVHFRINPKKEYDSPEFILSSCYGTGTTVYQGDNRFSLKGIKFFQNRIEFKKENKFFFRVYSTHEDAGKSYDPYFTALKILEKSKNNEQWSTDYAKWWKDPNYGNIPKLMRDLGYPVLDLSDPLNPKFDYAAAKKWLLDHRDTLEFWHNKAEIFANSAETTTGLPGLLARFTPGTPAFDSLFQLIISTKSNKKDDGTLFYDKSALYHAHGEYVFEPAWTNQLTVGANFRMYTPKSDGTIFYDTNNISITNKEFGVYAGIQKKLFDQKVTLSGTLRADKNANFDLLLSPAASIIYTPSKNNYLRFSFSSAIRNPTLTDQYLYLNVGRAILAGNIHGVQHLATVPSFITYLDTKSQDSLVYFDIAPIRPEKVKTFEIGYRTALTTKLYLDAGYYYNIYKDFIGYNLGLDIKFKFNDPLSLPEYVQAYRYSANSQNTVTTQGFSIGINYYLLEKVLFAGNYSLNVLNKTFHDDPIIPAYNTPKHKYNLSISARDLSVMDSKPVFGFNVSYKWVQGFLFEGSPQFTGFINSYGLMDAQVNYKFTSWNTTIKLGASNVLNNLHYETYGGPQIGRLAYLSLLYEIAH